MPWTAIGTAITTAGFGLAVWLAGYGFKDGWKAGLVAGVVVGILVGVLGFVFSAKGDSLSRLAHSGALIWILSGVFVAAIGFLSVLKGVRLAREASANESAKSASEKAEPSEIGRDGGDARSSEATNTGNVRVIGDAASNPTPTPTRPEARRTFHTRSNKETRLPMADEKKESGHVFNVTSNNQSGGITAGQIFLGKPRPTMGDDLRNQLLQLPPGQEAEIIIRANDGVALDFAEEIKEFLKTSGYRASGPHFVIGVPFAAGIQIDPVRSKIYIGRLP